MEGNVKVITLTQPLTQVTVQMLIGIYPLQALSQLAKGEVDGRLTPHLAFWREECSKKISPISAFLILVKYAGRWRFNGGQKVKEVWLCTATIAKHPLALLGYLGEKHRQASTREVIKKSLSIF